MSDETWDRWNIGGKDDEIDLLIILADLENDLFKQTEETIRLLNHSVILKGLFSAHIRKSYPKNYIDTAELHQHRILRRGIPFGDPSSETDEKGFTFFFIKPRLKNSWSTSFLNRFIILIFLRMEQEMIPSLSSLIKMEIRPVNSNFPFRMLLGK